jgi:hypothetical protein
MHDMDRKNCHLKEMMAQKESYYQNIIDNLQERVAEQAETIRTHASTIKAFITRLIPYLLFSFDFIHTQNRTLAIQGTILGIPSLKNISLEVI